jgi:hypothetical protein
MVLALEVETVKAIEPLLLPLFTCGSEGFEPKGASRFAPDTP